MENAVEHEEGRKRKHADGSETLKWAVIAEYNLHRRGIDGMLEDGKRQEIMDRFGVSSSTITRYVKEWEQQRIVAILPDLSPDRAGKCGVGNLKLTEYLVDCIFELSSEKKGSFTYESFTKDFNEEYGIEPPISPVTMFRWFQRLEAVQTMSYIKPQLQDHHVQARLQFIVNKTLPDGTPFDGKIGVFPVIKITQAKRNSKNRDAGADVVENVSMTAEEYLSIMTKEGGILDTIREKMQWARDDNIVIQHDGAPGHNGKGNREALAIAGQQHGYNITFQTQPAQSPDLNICDLCFFNSLQKRSFELRSKSNTEMELVNTVRQAWAEYDSDTLERAWGLLFAVYRAVLDAKGTNQYEKPHSGVLVRQRDGAGTWDPYVSQNTWLTAQEALDALNNA